MEKKQQRFLLDKAPQETINRVEKILGTYNEVMQFHSLKIRTAGADTFIKFNIHLSPTSNLTDAHALCDRIEKELSEAIPRSEIYIHAEPQDSSHLQSEGDRQVDVIS